MKIDNPSISYSEPVSDVRLPQDLITEILFYLPVKSLGKFKCVSKPWRSLISSPQFIKSHFSTSLKDAQRFNHQLLFVDPNHCMNHCSLSDALHNTSTNVSVIEYRSLNPKSYVEIVDIVNGLVCLFVGKQDLYVWNPILKQSKLLPGSGVLSSSIYVEHGFGYDESNDDYKVVQVFRECNVYQSKFIVYSLRGDSWGMMEGFMDWVTYRNGTYANGNISWISVNGAFDCGETWKIVSLNMASDMCEEVQAPCYDASPYECGIGSFGGSLSILSTKCNRADLWVRDENAWSKVFSLRYHDGVDNPFPEWHVVCILGDGEILLEDTSGLLVYHTKTKDLRQIQFYRYSYHEYCMYVESLVPV